MLSFKFPQYEKKKKKKLDYKCQVLQGVTLHDSYPIIITD